uniref:Uncharacterized protein n=1 Tax=Schistocephalus solidus TaxID=70667 RepID=A0A0X3PNR3_SCHSO
MRSSTQPFIFSPWRINRQKRCGFIRICLCVHAGALMTFWIPLKCANSQYIYIYIYIYWLLAHLSGIQNVMSAPACTQRQIRMNPHRFCRFIRHGENIKGCVEERMNKNRKNLKCWRFCWSSERR